MGSLMVIVWNLANMYVSSRGDIHRALVSTALGPVDKKYREVPMGTVSNSYLEQNPIALQWDRTKPIF